MSISVKGLTKKYGSKVIFSDVSFDVNEGEYVALIGPNGSGKSTFMSILAGVRKADAGSFVCNDFAYVPQGDPLIGELSGFDNLRLWISKEDIKDGLSDNGILKILKIDEYLKKPVNKMSGGMKKRLNIAIALLMKPKVLLLDEFSNELDLVSRNDCKFFLDEFKKKGGIIVAATHSMADIKAADKIYLFSDGRVTPYTFESEERLLVDFTD